MPTQGPGDGRASFLRNEFAIASISAAFQHSRIYRSSATAQQREEFRRELRRKLHALARRYAMPVTDAQHEARIARLSEVLSDRPCLQSKRFRIGSAQKALNLYLTYLWCLGEIPEPPHCPFDAGIIKALRLKPTIKWTALDDIDAYHRIVVAARSVARRDGVSLPVWELTQFNNGRL
jgi:hypothetical protein